MKRTSQADRQQAEPTRILVGHGPQRTVSRRIGAWPAESLLSSEVSFQQGELIVRADTLARSLFLVERGIVGRFVDIGGREVLEGTRTRGWLLGAVAALTSGKYETTIRAVTPSVLRPLAIHEFAQARRQLDVSMWLNEMFAAEIGAGLIRSALAKTPIQPIIEELFVEFLRAEGRPAKNGGIRLSVQMSVTSLAKLVGASREHTSRVLGDLEAVGTLVRVGGWFTSPVDSPLTSRVHQGAGNRV